MKLHLSTADNQHLITAYGAGFVAINHVRHTQSIIVMPDKLIENWLVQTLAEINAASFNALLELKPEVILLGTGETHQFLHPKHAQHLTQAGIALECMTTAAACRTYNILMSEGRYVAAALLV